MADDIFIISILLILGTLLYFFKCSFLISGYNTLSKEKKKSMIK